MFFLIGHDAKYFVLLVTFLIVEKLSFFEHTTYQFIGCNLLLGKEETAGSTT